MKWIMLLLVIIYIGNSPILQLVYPNVSSNYYSYVAFVKARYCAYEIMFFLFCMVIYFNTPHKLVKVITVFLWILVFGSVVDKCIFDISNYLITDIFLIIIALITSIYVYGRATKEFINKKS